MLLTALLVFLGATTSTLGCMSGARSSASANKMPNIDSASVDIPIHFDFQKGPLPSASISVGVDSRLNQNVGNGVYRQSQQTGQFSLDAAGIPVFDAQRQVQGISADVNLNLQRAQTVNYYRGNPMGPKTTQAPQAAHVANNVAAHNQDVGTPMKKPVPVAIATNLAAQAIPFQPTEAPTVNQQLRPEYIIALGVTCVASLVMLIISLTILLMRRKSRRNRTVNASVSAIEVENQGHSHSHTRQHRRHYPASVTGADSVYSAPVINFKRAASVTGQSGSVSIAVIEKPPAYDKD